MGSIYDSFADGKRQAFLDEAMSSIDKNLHKIKSETEKVELEWRVCGKNVYLECQGVEMAKIIWTGSYDGALFTAYVRRSGFCSNLFKWKAIAWKDPFWSAKLAVKEYFGIKV